MISRLRDAKRLSPAIWALGLTSLLMDTASESIHALLPAFLVGTLGATPVILGLIEGIGEGVTSATKPLAGYLSDRWRDRKWLTVFGYSLAALSKPLFAIAMSPAWVLAARVSDRFGKGIRGAPRDALIADITPAEIRGAAFGLRQALDTVGAFLGPLLAILLMTLLGVGLRTIFWLATIPAVLAVLVLVFGVPSPPRAKAPTAPRAKGHRWTLAFWIVCGIGGLLTFARFSEAFLLLRAQQAGLSVAWLPAVFIVMNAVYASGAYPAGLLADRVAPVWLIVAGAFCLVVSDLVLAHANTVPLVLLGVAIWGLHMALTQGVLSAMVAAQAPPDARGSAFGMFTLIGAVATLGANIVAGVLWEYHGPTQTFLFGAVLALASCVLAALTHRIGTPHHS